MEKVEQKETINFYDLVKEVLSKNKPFLKELLSQDKPLDKWKDRIRKEIKEKISGKFDYLASIDQYLNAAILRGDQEAKETFDEIFCDDFAADEKSWPLEIPYLAMRLEGLEDIIEIDMMRGISLQTQDTQFQIIPMAAVWETAKKVYPYSKYDIPLLIVGETGTSKELMARAIHRMSNRRKNNFRALNCAAISEDLLESELFGHERGSFTGAISKRKGILEEAHRGTVFLDEIAKASKEHQAKLLRVMEQGEIKPIGSNKTQKVDVRFIAATQPDSLKYILPDLKWRLGFPRTIKLSTLNERLTEWPPNLPNPVIKNSLRFALRKMKIKEPITISDEANSILVNHKYEGNYRELESILTDAIISAKSDGRTEIQGKDLMMQNEIDATLQPDEAKEEDHRTLPSAILKAAEDSKLRDIIQYADEVKALIVEHKLNSIKGSGRNIKSQLRSEGVPSKEYQNYSEKFRNIRRHLQQKRER